MASIPIFTDSIGMSILKTELAQYSLSAANPALAIRYYRVPSVPQSMTVQQALDVGDWLGAMTSREVGLSVERSHTQIGSHAFMIRTLPGDERYEKRDLCQVRINCVPGIEEQIEIVEGMPFLEAETSGELLVWARPRLLEELGIEVGEKFELFNYNAVHPDRPPVFRIAGVWQAKDPTGPFWYTDPHRLLELEFLTSLGAFARFVAPIMPQQIDYTFWYYVLDENRLRFDKVDQYTRGVEVAQMKAQRMLPYIKVDCSPIEPLREVQERTQVLERLLFGFSLPVMALLLVFVAAISSIAMRYQRNEIAIFMSRGASRSQVFVANALEGLLHIVLGLPPGLWIGRRFAQLMSLNSGFMSFDRVVPLALVTQGLDWYLVGLALVLSLLARLVPAYRLGRSTIVSYGRERAREGPPDWTVRLLLTAVLIAASAYAYYQLHSRGTFGFVIWEPGGETVSDPLLFLAPTLFMVTAALIFSRIFSILVRIPDFVGQFLKPPLYLGFRNLARQSGTYTTAIFLVIMCLCLGAFVASVALSADSWLVDQFRYKAGADYCFTQGVAPEESGSGISGVGSWLLPIEEYRKLTGVTDATRVGEYVATPVVHNQPSIRLLGIDRLDFGRVAYFRRDYAEQPLGELLNLLGATRNGILLRREDLASTSFSLGDRLTLDVYVEGIAKRIDFVIVGVFDYFPTMYPDERSVAVTNLDFIHDQFGGAQPHGIWLRTLPDTDTLDLRSQLKRKGVVTLNEKDSRAMVREDMERLERVGIFGSLTVGFLAGSLLACLGLLVHTVASLVAQIHRFAILRALGMESKQVLATVSVEYLSVVFYGIVAGAAAGITASVLFVPYYQFTSDASLQLPPFVPEIAWGRLGWISIAYLCVLTLAEIIVLLVTTRTQVFQALRLGDEE